MDLKPTTQRPVSISDYGRILSPAIPEIAWSERWKSWIVPGDLPVEKFRSLDDFEAENLFRVVVDEDNGWMRIVNEGSGAGRTEWIVKAYFDHSGQTTIGLSVTSFTPERTDGVLTFMELAEGEWKNVAEGRIPPIQAHQFFDDDADLQLIERFPLFTLSYNLLAEKDIILISGHPNQIYACAHGEMVLDHADLDPEDQKAICHLWDHQMHSGIRLEWTPETGNFGIIGHLNEF